jgi:MFS transporter, DHA3 family, macrolide efflux protein
MSESEQTLTEAPAEPRANFVSVLRNSNFRNLWLGQVVSQVGDYFVFLALTVVVVGFSGNGQETTLAVSGMMISFSLPRLLFGLLAGVFVDRWDRRRTMLVSDILRAIITLVMIPAVLSANLWALYALAFVMSAVGTLFNPAKGALIPNLVDKEQLLSANSLSQTSQMLAMLMGPALAGVTLKIAGTGNEWIAFVIDSVSYMVSAFAIWMIRVPKAVAVVQEAVEKAIQTSGSAVARVWSELLVGLRALVLNRNMGLLTLIFAVTMLGIGAVNVLWIVFLTTRFGFEGPELAWRVSLLDIGFGVGMIASSVVAGNFFSKASPKWYVVFALVGVGFSLGIFGFLPDYWSMFVVTLIMGAFVAPINTGAVTYMQILVPNSQLGRVGGGFATVADFTSIVSMSLAGVAGAALGIPVVFAVSGTICVLMGIVTWLVLPALTLADQVHEEEAAPETPAISETPTDLRPEPSVRTLQEVERAS